MWIAFDEFRRALPERQCHELLLNAKLGGWQSGCRACAGADRLEWRARTQTLTCRHCGHSVSARAGTPFGKLHLPLTEWFYAVSLALRLDVDDLPDALRRELGRSLDTTTRLAREATVIVGRDGRRSPPPWASSLTARIAEQSVSSPLPGGPANAQGGPEPGLGRPEGRLAILGVGVAALTVLLLWSLLYQDASPHPSDHVNPPSLIVQRTSMPSISLKEVDFDPSEVASLLDQLARERVSSYEHLVEDAVAPGPHRPDGVLRFGTVSVPRSLVQDIVRAAHRVQVNPVLLMAIADKESSFRPHARAKTSSATGLYQFIEATWLKVVRDFGSQHGLEQEAGLIQWQGDALVVTEPSARRSILDLRLDSYLSAAMAAEMLKANASRIAQRIGRPLTTAENYLAHFLGQEGAVQLLTVMVANPASTASELMPRPARANRQIFYGSDGRREVGLSVVEVHRKLEVLMQTRLQRYHQVRQALGNTRSLRLLPLVESLVPHSAADPPLSIESVAVDRPLQARSDR